MNRIPSYLTLLLLAVAFSILVFNTGCTPSRVEHAKMLEIKPENAGVLNDIGRYPDLEIVSISCLETLPALPDSIGKLTGLRELKIDNGNGCSMNPVLPESIGRLRTLEKLVLYGAQDPREGAQPHQRHQFPLSMSQLKNLTYLDLGRNGLDQIPDFVKDLPRLRELGFEYNMNLKEVPPFLSGLRELTTLRLGGNGLRDLPDFLNDLPQLKLITLGENCAITQDEGKMKDLRRRFAKIDLEFEGEYDCPDK